MKYKGVIIEESLVDKNLLKLCKITSTQTSKDSNPKTNAGEPKWTLHQVEVPESNLKEVTDRLSENLRLPNWWADLSSWDNVYIIFHDKIFKGKNSDNKFRKEVISYAHLLNLPDGQIPLSG